ncbi:MAG TPA: aldo/keto reductase [Armatimonadota bacterium]|jgi:aryl-alcohol dehydrogenase-like predicted oxidoreductase
MSKMEKHAFGRTGLSVSGLGFGGAPIGYLETDQQRISVVLNELLDAGVNVIDTAASYAGSEEAIGRAVGHRRADYVLVSKCGQAFDDVPGEAWSPAVISATVDRALRRLKTDHLDVMLLHSCTLEVLQKGEALGALIGARDAGKIRFAGYSGDNDAAAFAAASPEVTVVEMSINICDQSNIDRALAVAREHHVGVIAKRPVANTAWRPLDSLDGMYQAYAKAYHERFGAMGMTLEELGLDPSITDWTQVALLFTLAQPGIATAIVGTTNPDNARRNVETLARGPLPEEAVAKIRAAFRSAQQRSGEPWPALQ